jgi:hypothetical protein
MERVHNPEDITNGVGGRQGHGGPDQRGVEQDHREQCTSKWREDLRQSSSDRPCVHKRSCQRGAGEGSGGGDHETSGPKYHHNRADRRVQPLVVQPAGGDALIDDVGLLKEELPWGHGGPDDAHDEEDRGGVDPASDVWNDHIVHNSCDAGMAHQSKGHGQEIEQDEDVHKALSAAEAAGDRDADEEESKGWHRDGGADTKILHGQAQADELGQDGTEVEEEEIANPIA